MAGEDYSILTLMSEALVHESKAERFIACLLQDDGYRPLGMGSYLEADVPHFKTISTTSIDISESSLRLSSTLSRPPCGKNLDFQLKIQVF
ncbi:hypothetical protein [Heyndrickxia acidicola]|uniref:Uncharacterized protein n=1 Tax=Heyndrickxia acidicola TaxID=209389 RepID=A0ABU6MBF5_9BACI|nr:hypothetical protein [Heyndrickxia acidicola]MED1201845.1 hypothetical protein [Heyndrickxia acidicola]